MPSLFLRLFSVAAVAFASSPTVRDNITNAPTSTPITSAPTNPPTAPVPTPGTVAGDAMGHLSLNSFVPYPTNPGWNVSGYVLLSHRNGEVTITYNLTGVDQTCTTRDDETMNSCGMHIHVGFSCQSDSAVGTHYWDTKQMSDPWLSGPSYYTVDAGLAKGEKTITYGYGVDASKGHAFVIHDRKGNRIACGVLPATTDKVTLGYIAPYPEYMGPFMVQGKINMDFRGMSVAIGYVLTGVDPKCTSPDPNTPLSCGLHIHAGMTCSNASAIGGHFYDAGYMPSTHSPLFGDPWSNVAYTATPDGSAMGMLQVDYGYGFTNSSGRAVVLHDYTGARIACVLIPSLPERETAPLPALAPIPGYTGSVMITGSVKLDFRGGGVKILYNLVGTEPTCANAPGDALNSCGIHIHSGVSCANPGGHYYDSMMYKVDPWKAATYKSQTGEASLIVSSGYGFDESKGRVVVVHAYDGTKVACAVIPATTTVEAVVMDFKPFNGAFTNLSPTSMVTFDFRFTGVRLTYKLAGADPACVEKTDAPNSCGLHIHAGMDCINPGEHYYDATKFAVDPWQMSSYMVAPDGSGSGTVDIEYGYGWAQSKGHAVVIHNQAGDPVACSMLPTQPGYTAETAGIAKLAPLEPGNPQTGTVVVAVSGLGVKLTYSLTEVEPACAMAGPKPLSCGIHIHKGFSCDNPGGHYYNNVSYPVDPWMYSSYVSDGNKATGSVVVSYGESWMYTEGRTVVIHNYEGAKVACAVIPATTDQVVAMNFRKLDVPWPVNLTGTVVMDFRVTSVQLTYHFTNADGRCVMRQPGPSLSCGLHIHAGMSCDTQSAVGTHYYDNKTFPEDPWMMSYFKTDAQGTALGVLNVEYGYGYEMSKGHALVVHDYDGNKVSCTLVPAQKAENSDLKVTIESVSRYPGYGGPYAVVVQGTSISWSGMGAKLAYNLTGVPCECSQMGSAANSCGLHIHEGSSCTEATAIGGHWYNKMTYAADPWSVAPYTSGSCADASYTGMTTAVGELTVDFGYTAEQSLDKVVVIHDYLGNRVACAPVGNAYRPSPRDLDMTGTLLVPALGRFPGAEKFPNASGTAALRHTGNEVSISYRFMHVDPACVEGGRQTGVKNSCGMHIHMGFSCANAGLIGGHYFNVSMGVGDPWQESYYVVGADGVAMGEMNVAYGHSIDETKGRTFVLHDRDGAPFTCAVLGSTADKVFLGAIEAYPGTKPTTRVMGCVGLEFRGTSVQISYNLTGVDKRCTAPSPDYALSCGLHVHAGTCENATTVGGHYYDSARYALDEEPWKNVAYKSDGAGNAMTTLATEMLVENGYGFDTTKGRAVVLHDFEGNRITCNTIPGSADRDVVSLPPLSRYAGYDGAVTITGSVKLDFRGPGVKISYNLMGVEPACTMPGTAPNSCGIHIHQGFACDETAGGHYYNSTLYMTDPWSFAPYNSESMPGSLIVSYGFDYERSKGRALVVHDYAGKRAACAVIPQTTDHATATNFQKLPDAGAEEEVKGMVDLDFRAINVRIAYNLTGVDPRCEATLPEVANSCGIHIHAGMSCSEPGLHYYNTAIVPMDPWASVTYKAEGSMTRGVVNVEHGYNYMMSKGHAFVIHDQEGKKVSCAVISTGNAPRDTASLVTLMPILPGTPVQGKAVVDLRGMGVRISYDLTGVESNCSTAGPNKLSCGLHIHQGFNCTNPMGHYYNNMSYPEDPWMYTTYTSLGTNAQGSVVVSYGEDWAHTAGRALVIHNYAGEKVACQTLPALTHFVEVTGFTPVPTTPEWKVAGFVELNFRTTSVHMNVRLTGTDPACRQRTAAENSCGIHIHYGTCTAIGTHFYSSATISPDPWAPIYYTSNEGGDGTALVDVEYGFGYEESKGKVIVVHALDGSKLACAPIGPEKLEAPVSRAAPMVKYPAYAGTYSPSLEAELHYTDQAFTISYNLTGVPCECAQVGTAPNSCGLHIHAGASCATNDLVGGHWFAQGMADPWAYTPYMAEKCSDVCTHDCNGTTASGSLTVMYGKDYVSTIARVLVVHDYMGGRIGCAPIKALNAAPATDSGKMNYLPYVLGGAGGLLLLILIAMYCRHRRARRVGTLNEKLVQQPTAALGPKQDPNRRTLSVQRM